MSDKLKIKTIGMSEFDKVKALCDGDEVMFYGLRVRAEVVIGDDDPCDVCDMSSICHYEMSSLCRQCDDWANKDFKLDLVDA